MAHQNDDDNAPIPTRVGPYRISQRLGQGGMAEVLLGVRRLNADLVTENDAPQLAASVVIKLLRLEWTEDKNYMRYFRREAEIASQLDHPAILRVQEVGEHMGRPYLVLPFVDAVTLKQFMCLHERKARRLLDFQVVKYIVGTLLGALANAKINLAGSSQQVVHRDIKPENVLIRATGHPLLIDFGIAHLETRGTTESPLIGTLAYMAPELFQGFASPRSDLYSMGVLLHELITGSTPYHGWSSKKIQAEFRTDTPVPTASRFDVIRHQVVPTPGDLEHLRVALLQKNPDHRPPDAATALQMLTGGAGYVARDQMVADSYFKLVGERHSGLTSWWLSHNPLPEASVELPSPSQPRAQKGELQSNPTVRVQTKVDTQEVTRRGDNRAEDAPVAALPSNNRKKLLLPAAKVDSDVNEEQTTRVYQCNPDVLERPKEAHTEVVSKRTSPPVLPKTEVVTIHGGGTRDAIIHTEEMVTPT